jgi:hypothetical protein
MASRFVSAGLAGIMAMSLFAAGCTHKADERAERAAVRAEDAARRAEAAAGRVEAASARAEAAAEKATGGRHLRK